MYAQLPLPIHRSVYILSDSFLNCPGRVDRPDEDLPFPIESNLYILSYNVLN
jgi:hypothetical protein